MLKAKRFGGAARLPTSWELAGVVLLLVLAGMGYVVIQALKGAAPAGGKASFAPLPMDHALKVKVAQRLDPELMSIAPPGGQFEADIKNHCWKVPGAQGAQPEMRCLPYWYITGSFQAGTENLLFRVREHPDIITNEVTRWHFWGEDAKQAKGYVQHVQKSLPEIMKDPKNKIVLDSSASTLAFYWSAALRTHRAFQKVMVPCWGECGGAAKGNETARQECLARTCYPNAQAADRAVAAELGVPYESMQLPLLMSALYGPVKPPKLVFLLRNPTERLHSAYWFYHHYKNKYGQTPQGFLKYVQEQIGELQACEKRPGLGRTPEGCALWFEALGPIEEQLFFHADQIMRGMYALYLEHWLAHFPRDHLLIIKSEDYFKDPMAATQQVFKFLGLRELTAPELEKVAKSAPNTPTTKQAMLPEAKKLVMDFYRPWNTKLAKLLNDPYYLTWNESP